MDILVSQCFVEVQVATQSYSIYAAVHYRTLTALNQDVEPTGHWYTFNCVRASVVDENFDSFGHLSYSNVAAHAQRLTHDRFAKVTVLNTQLEVCCYDTVGVAKLLSVQIALRSAEQIYMRALAGYEKALGPDHTSTLITVNNLGLLYVDQRKLDKAGAMYMRALGGWKKALGYNHPSTVRTRRNLRNLWNLQGNDEAM